MKAAKKHTGIKLPKNIAEVADLYKKTRDDRLAAQKAVEEMAKQESVLYNYLIDHLSASNTEGVQGKLARVAIVTRTVPVFDSEDEKAREKFFKFARKAGNEGLLTESMNAAAVKERWEAGKTVPGIIKFNVKKLSLHAVKSKK